MAYVALCGLCRGNRYITVVVEGKEEIKECWLCESKGERILKNQAEVDKFIYETYFKKE